MSVNRLSTLILLLIAWLLVGRNSSAETASEPASLVTRDGVQLKISYFPSSARKGSPQAKQVTPIVMLHDYKSSRAVFAPLVEKFQAPAAGDSSRPQFAVVTVDLRAHGESVKQVFANGAQVDLDAAKVNKDDLAAMAAYDMEAVRSFLVDKNDAGELNLNKLCLIGAGMGASVAANWALVDWSAPPLAVGKQGQDVKGIVLLSPRWTFNGLSMQGPMQFRKLKENVAWMIVYGEKDAKVQADITRLRKQIERFHPKSEKAGDSKTSSFTVLGLDTKLQNEKLLTQFGGSTDDKIVEFLTKNVARLDQAWMARRNRLP
jgi:pimeloyl-ACP methyl ester carboxylesterase